MELKYSSKKKAKQIKWEMKTKCESSGNSREGVADKFEDAFQSSFTFP